MVLASRNHDDLRDVTNEIVDNGGKAIAGVADVADPGQGSAPTRVNGGEVRTVLVQSYNDAVALGAAGTTLAVVAAGLTSDAIAKQANIPETRVRVGGVLGGGLYFINAHDDGSPDRNMLHTGSPPTAGQKWIVSQFIRNIALRP